MCAMAQSTTEHQGSTELPRTPCMRTSENAQKAKFALFYRPAPIGPGCHVRHLWTRTQDCPPVETLVSSVGQRAHARGIRASGRPDRVVTAREADVFDHLGLPPIGWQLFHTWQISERFNSLPIVP